MSRIDGVIVCYIRCWPCQFGQHYDPPQRHTWMDDDDVDHAQATGQDANPDNHLCGCLCAKATS